MSPESSMETTVARIVESDPRYAPQAYTFVLGVITEMHDDIGEKRHLSGQELLGGLKKYGSGKFGPMAKEVFNSWGVYVTSDFGNIVYNLIEAGLLVKTSEDEIGDFDDGFDFATVFEEDYFRN